MKLGRVTYICPSIHHSGCLQWLHHLYSKSNVMYIDFTNVNVVHGMHKAHVTSRFVMRVLPCICLSMIEAYTR